MESLVRGDGVFDAVDIRAVNMAAGGDEDLLGRHLFRAVRARDLQGVRIGEGRETVDQIRAGLVEVCRINP